ncbi:hypothetical protein HPB49_003629 [Dermacentor silvarum]|uniref:Uncharacterized protein n=1 Tax=Dermacentor silvarum TaxID=543639 RepID=A0ACB8CP80_DERSI|nr:hypothetical protein HPB49_003629 [Dermacentor silvarum]
MACGGGDPCIAGPSTRKRSFSFLSSSSSDDDSDTDVYLVSGSDDSDDGELSSSSGDDEDSSKANIASARQWILLDVDNPPVKPPRFPFLAIPGKTFNLSSSDDLMEYIQQFLDDELISLVVDETNRKAVETLKRSPPSEHSRLKKWVPVTKEEITVHTASMETFKDSKGRDVTKPSIVRDYNHTMGGVDKSDQMLSDYPVPRKRQKIYYKKIFRHLIDEATFNSFVLYQKDGGKMSHLDYRLALIEAILTRYLDPSKKTKRG